MRGTLQKKASLFSDAHFSFTVMLLGDSCTGKTCLLIRFKDGTFMNNNFISTVGIDYRVCSSKKKYLFFIKFLLL
jgi:GTPase SAR1 family protein